MRVNFRLILILLALPALSVSVSGTPIEKNIQCEEALAGAYDKTITTVPGDGRPFMVVINGEETELRIYSQPENERRVNLADNSKTPGSVTNSLLRDFFRAQHEMLKLATLNEANIGPEAWTGAFYLAPLNSQFEQFHESSMSMNMRSKPRKLNQWTLGVPEKGALVRELLGWDTQIVHRHRGEERMHSTNDYITSKYYVGWRNETGIYFDSADGVLESQGIAVREKFWFEKEHPPEGKPLWPSPEELKNSVQTSLTIKLTRPHDGLFTVRDEHFIPLPAGMPPEVVTEVARQALISIFGRDPLAGKDLKMIKRVDTERLGLKLMYSKASPISNPLEVGFMTVDRFMVFDFKNPGAAAREPISQLEIELLPPHIPTLAGDLEMRGYIEAFFKAVESRLNAKENPTPKYLQ